MSQLYPYVQDDEQRIWLDNLLAKDNRSGFKEFMESNCVSLVDLLTDQLSSAVIPLVDFLHIVPFIQPRFYTISSSASLYPSTIHITIGLMQRLTANKKTSMGLCSQFCKVHMQWSTCVSGCTCLYPSKAVIFNQSNYM